MVEFDYQPDCSHPQSQTIRQGTARLDKAMQDAGSALTGPSRDEDLARAAEGNTDKTVQSRFQGMAK